MPHRILRSHLSVYAVHSSFMIIIGSMVHSDNMAIAGSGTVVAVVVVGSAVVVGTSVATQEAQVELVTQTL